MREFDDPHHVVRVTRFVRPKGAEAPPPREGDTDNADDAPPREPPVLPVRVLRSVFTGLLAMVCMAGLGVLVIGVILGGGATERDIWLFAPLGAAIGACVPIYLWGRELVRWFRRRQ